MEAAVEQAKLRDGAPFAIQIARVPRGDFPGESLRVSLTLPRRDDTPLKLARVVPLSGDTRQDLLRLAPLLDGLCQAAAGHCDA